jgi:ribose transport system ATP-binding protein
VLILDEPTVFLPEEEIDRLFDLIRTVVAEGAAVLFISHDLAAVQAITDRVVVLRDGRVVAEEVTASIDEEALVDLIVGASASARQAAVDTSNVVALVEDKRAVEATREAMQSVGDAADQGESVRVEGLVDDRLHGVSFEIGAGEILGVAGLIGSGAEELPYLLFGARQAISGSLRLGAEQLNCGKLTPQRSVRERIALVPADRAVQGLSQGLTLWENITMLVEDEHYRGGIFRRGELLKLAQDAIDRFLIRPALPHAPAGTFSGGNQQKALMAKWLIARPRLLLLHEPTQGVDVGARRDIYRFVKAAATLNQMAVLWVTTEFGELAEVCDRVIVLTQGQHTETLTGEELSEEAISAAALRQTREVS